MHLLGWIIVGLIAGWATGKIMKGSGYGVVMDIVVGVAGAILGRYLLRIMGVPSGKGFVAAILVAILGGVILTAVFRLVTKRA